MNRDIGIDLIRARPDRRVYGMGLGVMILDEVYPGFPGDVRNASAYPFPIQYEVMEGLNCYNICQNKGEDEVLVPSIVKAAKKLERMGVKAIIAECGYFAYFQKIIAGQVNVPVFMSSLVQVPLAQLSLGPQKAVGIFCGVTSGMSDAHLTACGIDLNSNFYLYGCNEEKINCPEFMGLWHEGYRKPLPEASYLKTEEQIVSQCQYFVDQHPDIGALVLECTGFQPFGRAIQRAVDLPVYDWSTLMDYAYSVTVHRDFYGHV